MPEIKKNDKYQKFTFEVPLTTESVPKNTKKEFQKNNIEKRKTIAMIGDRFMRGQFFSADTLEKSAPLWENTFHDINHMGTTFRAGLAIQSNILYFVGWQDNVQYDSTTKALSMNIHPKLNTRYGKDWQAFIELCEETGRTPNVSISFLGKIKMVKASSLPAGTNYEAYGYKANDLVPYIYDIIPQALSTVLQGLCNDKAGCGIGVNNSCEDGSCELPPKETPPEETPPKKEPEIEDTKVAEKRAYLEKRLKQIKWRKN